MHLSYREARRIFFLKLKIQKIGWSKIINGKNQPATRNKLGPYFKQSHKRRHQKYYRNMQVRPLQNQIPSPSRRLCTNNRHNAHTRSTLLRETPHTIITQTKNGQMSLRTNERHHPTSHRIHLQIHQRPSRRILLQHGNTAKRHQDHNRIQQRKMGINVQCRQKGQIRTNTAKGIHQIPQSIQRNLHRKPESKRHASKPRHERTLPVVMGINWKRQIIRCQTRNQRQNPTIILRANRHLSKNSQQMVGSLSRRKNSPDRRGEPRCLRAPCQLLQNLARRVRFRRRS